MLEFVRKLITRSRKKYVTWVWSEPNSDIGLLLFAIRNKGLGCLVQPRHVGVPDEMVQEFLRFSDPDKPLWSEAVRWFEQLGWSHPVRAWFTPRYPRSAWSFYYIGVEGREKLPWNITEAQIREWEQFHGIPFVQVTVREATLDFYGR